jgi:hypothetical protein
MGKVIVLKEVHKSDSSFLYELLSERKSYENISHKKNPTYVKHVKFVMSKPYSKWYIIYHATEKIGSIYLTKQDEIGIHFQEQNITNKIRSKVLKMIIKKNPRNRYLININPSNTRMKNFLKNEGFELMQHTYEISKKISRV